MGSNHADAFNTTANATLLSKFQPWSFIWEHLFFMRFDLGIRKKEWVVDTRLKRDEVLNDHVFSALFGLLILTTLFFLCGSGKWKTFRANLKLRW